jgi:hypothetical protein
MLAVASRRELATYFATLDPAALRPAHREERDLIEGLAVDEVVLSFAARAFPKRGVLPDRIVVHESAVEDFFAWASTYVEALTPLTAFIEVLSRREALEPRTAAEISTGAMRALLGAVMADGLAQTKARVRAPDSLLPAMCRTMSVVFLQCLLRNSYRSEIADATALWLRIRSLLSSSEMPYSIDDVLRFWSTVAPILSDRVGNGDRAIGAAVRASIERPGRNPWTDQADLVRGFDVDDFLRLSREERLRLADDLIRNLRGSSAPAELKSAIGGYLLSLVGDGDFGLWPTAMELRADTTVPLWFGFFSGANERTNLLDYGQSVCRRLLAVCSFAYYDADIDAREFIISKRLKTRAAVDFPLANQGVMKAKLAPGVFGWFSVRDGHTGAPTPPRDGVEQRQPLAAASLKRLAEARNLAERLLLLLSQMPNEPRDSAGEIQLELGPAASKTPRRKRKR